MNHRSFGQVARAAVVGGALLCATAAQAVVLTYTATLNGANESPPNASPGTGNATVTIDTVTNQMTVFVIFTGLSGTVTASHIHAPTVGAFTGTAGVATTTPTFPGFPSGVTSGSYNAVFDLLSPATYNPAYLTANGGSVATAEAALLSAISTGNSYLNIHTTQVPAGEIRGFLAAVVPEPASWAMMLFGFGAIGIAIRRRPRATASDRALAA